MLSSGSITPIKRPIAGEIRSTAGECKDIDCKKAEGTQNKKEIGAVYTPLDISREEIRIVTVAPGAFEDEIYCHLSTVSLQDNPFYEALSYAWGPPEFTSKIYLNDIPFQATNNLVSALQNLRYKDCSKEMWIDALCINQKDILKQSSQVRIMHKIYRRASTVMAWLGEKDDNSDLVFDAFEAFPKGIETHWSPGVDPILRKVVENCEYSLDVRDLFQRSWWQRVWVVQESALGTTFVFACGQRQIPWDLLRLGMESYFKHLLSCCYNLRFSEEYPQLNELDVPMGILDDLKELRTCQHRSNCQTWIGSFHLQGSQLYQPPGQGVWITGIARDDDTKAIEPNYSTRPSKVYESVTLRLIESSQTLKVFSQLSPLAINTVSKVGSELPSWVPDWTCEGNYNQFMSLVKRFDCLRYYSATKGSSASLTQKTSGKISLRGITFSTFSVLGSSIDDLDEHAETIKI
jgi:hypothetical protein